MSFTRYYSVCSAGGSSNVLVIPWSAIEVNEVINYSGPLSNIHNL